MIPIEILVMTSGAVGAVAIVVAARPDRRRFGLRLPRAGGVTPAGTAGSEPRDGIRSEPLRR